jgi:ubiquinone/menaquinone biosynthesis C-methylase UbiE
MKSKTLYPATDYSGIAARYDRVREMPDQNLDLWIREIIRLGHIRRESVVLEVGCGTGRFAIALWELTNSRIVGLDVSPGMLNTAKTKPSAANIEWIEAHAETIPYAGKAFDCVFMVFAMHHFQDKRRALEEICRVLKPGGRLVIATASHGMLQKEIVFRIFPELLRIESSRFPPIPKLRKLLGAVGFVNPVAHRVTGEPAWLTKEAYTQWILKKPISTFHMLSEQNFKEGLRRFQAMDMPEPLPQCLVYHSCMLVSCQKGATKPTNATAGGQPVKLGIWQDKET